MTAELETSGERGPDPREALERFVRDNEDLARLEKLTGRFNIFEALGMVRQEIRHSNFLARLLNPAQNHGLGDSFLRGFLLKTSAKTSVKASEGGSEAISPSDVEAWDLSATEVRREWKHIDITLLDQSIKFVCVIENKVDSGEHDEQLRLYREVVEGAFPDYTHHYVLLNVSGEAPSDSYYVGVTYDEVCEVIERVLEMRASTIGDDVATALSHYVTMIRRRIMPDAEIQELCRRIYRKHQGALDLIYEYRPDRQAAISDALLEMIRADRQEFIIDAASKSRIRFLPVSWDRSELHVGQGFTKTGRLLLFEFWNNPNWLGFGLTLGPGDENVRRQIYEAATKAGSPFTLGPKGLSTKFVYLFSKEILPTADYDDPDFDKVQSRVQEAWSAFKSNELPLIKDVIDQVPL